MSAQHTPGPWKVEADPENAGKHYYHDHRFVTSGVDTLDSEKGFYENDCRRVCMLFDTENQLEDARLIAAAPELRAALRIIVANAQIIPDASMGGATDIYAVPLGDIDAARAAIAKATGTPAVAAELPAVDTDTETILNGGGE